MLELVLLDGSGRRFALGEGSELSVGVAAHNAVRLASPDVSRAHALVTNRNGRLIVLDLGSTNGTYVNGKRVKEAELAAGDVVRFSSVVAQVLPPGSDAASRPQEVETGGVAARPPADDGARSGPKSDRLHSLVSESLGGLLTAWSTGGRSAVEQLVEWLVRQRGARGAAVLETIAGEVAVLAADGEIRVVLDDPACAALLAGGGAAASPEEIVTEIGGVTVMAMKAAALPWLLLVPGRAMPELGELALIAPLLAVARRLDGAG